jgi:nicotinamidase-related amidase
VKEEPVLTLRLRWQRLRRDEAGHALWVPVFDTRRVLPRRSALLLCDVWDRHWCRGANERLAQLVPRMAETVRSAREMGLWIIHAPSDTMAFYRDTPARQRIATLPPLPVPAELAHEDPPLPIDHSDGGSDTDADPGAVDEPLWSRQHGAIEIDQERDVISDDGREIYTFLRTQGVEHLLMMGVHTNMCILGRSFGIKQMVRWGVEVMLCGDLTDAMYNPALPPYVSHSEGTRLAIAYIEKFWCPTFSSEDLRPASAAP